jgi:hypothetical protein
VNVLAGGGTTLDTARVPQDLIPGDLDALDDTITGLVTLGVSGQEAGSGMTRLCTGEGWTGAAADAFREIWRLEPDRWSSLGEALSSAAQALQPYREAVRAAQGQALLAITEWREAQQVSATAALVYQQAGDAHDGETLLGEQPAPMAPFVDPGAAGRAAATQRLAEARTSVVEAALAALHVLSDARDSLPSEPGMWSRFGEGFVDTFSAIGTQAQDFAGGAVDATIGMIGTVQRLNPGSVYNETHPEQYQRRLGEAGQAVANVAAHPVTAVQSMVHNAVQSWTHDPGRALGSLVPGVALGAVTGGAGDVAAAGSEVVDDVAGEVAGLAPASESATQDALDATAADRAAMADSSVGTSTPWGSWNFGPGAAQADAATAAGIQDSGVGLGQVERDLNGIHVHADPTASDPASPDTPPAPVRPITPAHSVSRGPEWGKFAGWDLPVRPLTTDPIAVADRAAVRAFDSAGVGLSQVERDLGQIHVRPAAPPAGSSLWAGAGGKLPPDRSVGGFDLTPPARTDTVEPGPARFGRLPADYTDRAYTGGGALQRAYLDRYPPSPADLQWLDGVRARWPGAERLTDVDLLALHQYSTSAFEINGALRSGNPVRLEALDTEIRVTASTLNKLPDHGGLVMRADGSNLSPDQIDQVLRTYEPGSIVQVPGFVSGAKSSIPYGNIEYNIVSHHGKDLTPLTDTGLEQVMFPPGSHFRVDDRLFNRETKKWQILLTNVER